VGHHRGAASEGHGNGGKAPSQSDTGMGRALRYIKRAFHSPVDRSKRFGLAQGDIRSEIQLTTEEADLLYKNQSLMGSDMGAKMIGQLRLIEPLKEDTSMLLTKREKTHGVYRDNASLSQSIKDVLRSGKNWENLTDGQKEALEMIAVKLSRLLTGDANYRDHWDDIVGYAQLGGQGSPVNMPTISNDLQEAMGQ